MHLASELFTAMAKVKIQHVPYRGSPQAITDLLAKRVDFQVDTPQVMLPFIQDGRLRPLAITGNKPFFALPGVSTMETSGNLPGYAVTGWAGLGAPAGLPADMVAKLNGYVRETLAEPSVIERLRKLGADLTPTTPEGFKARVQADIAKWTKVINDANIPKI
jgi:tripartite-type tricarboxylate transporter receptor subunit TctC